MIRKSKDKLLIPCFQKKIKGSVSFLYSCQDEGYELETQVHQRKTMNLSIHIGKSNKNNEEELSM